MLGGVDKTFRARLLILWSIVLSLLVVGAGVLVGHFYLTGREVPPSLLLFIGGVLGWLAKQVTAEQVADQAAPALTAALGNGGGDALADKLLSRIAESATTTQVNVVDQIVESLHHGTGDVIAHKVANNLTRSQLRTELNQMRTERNEREQGNAS